LSFASFGISQNTQNLQGAGTNFYKHLYGTIFNASSRGAMDALVYISTVRENDYVLEALQARGYSYTVATDWTDFDTKLASGNYGLAVAFVQTGQTYPSLIGLQSFINTGGKVIFDDYNRNEDGYASLFEASYTGNLNFTSMTIIDPTLLNGLSNPVEIHNPEPSGWGIYSMGMTTIGAGEVLATFPSVKGDRSEQAAIIKGNGGNTIILGYLSDTPFDLNPAKGTNNRQILFQNVLGSLDQPPVPVSPWALVFGIFLIAVFMVIRYKRNLA